MKINYVLKKINNNLHSINQEWKQDKKNFSNHLAYTRLLSNLFRIIRMNKLSIRYSEKKNEIILAWLKNKYGDIFLKPRTQNTKKDIQNKEYKEEPVWVFWYSGIETAPALVRRCVESIYEHANGHPVHLLNKHNLDSYIELPLIFKERLNNREIGLAHFSDVLRVYLLEKYGGLWLDATIFCNKNLPENYFTNEFFSCKSLEKTPGCVSQNRWTTFCIGGKPGNILFRVLKDFFYAYWNQEKAAIDYLFFDDAIYLTYTMLIDAKREIDNVPINNVKRDLLIKRFADKWEASCLEDLLGEGDVLFKLGYREAIYLQEKNPDGEDTIYSAFIKHIF